MRSPPPAGIAGARIPRPRSGDGRPSLLLRALRGTRKSARIGRSDLAGRSVAMGECVGASSLHCVNVNYQPLRRFFAAPWKTPRKSPRRTRKFPRSIRLLEERARRAPALSRFVIPMKHSYPSARNRVNTLIPVLLTADEEISPFHFRLCRTLSLGFCAVGCGSL